MPNGKAAVLEDMSPLCVVSLKPKCLESRPTHFPLHGYRQKVMDSQKSSPSPFKQLMSFNFIHGPVD